MAKVSFKKWRASLNGDDALDMFIQYGDVVGNKMTHTEGGVYTWGQDSVDLTGLVPDVHSNSASWEAFRYLKYLKVARKRGFTAGPYVYLGQPDDE